MHPRQTLAQYCESGILDIPKALYEMRDIKPMLFNGESAIFHKDLERDLVNIEFYTRVPCIVYIETGKEVITTCNNKSFEINAGEAIFLPRGLNLYSDYIHEGSGLNAYLLFFGSEVLSRFLSVGSALAVPVSNEQAIRKIRVGRAVKEYFASFGSIYESLNNSAHLLQLKLLELLYLLEMDDDGSLRAGLLAVQTGRAKRNIKRLMDQYAISGVSAKELAALSGRSVSTFNREFKALYDTTPKQWLIDRRLVHARSLLSRGGWPVTAVAAEVGYGNISHFIEAFKKKYGKTPRQIRSEE